MNLCIEHLEPRNLVALAAFSVNLYADDTIQVGEEFTLEITAQDTRDNPRGLGGISLDIAWDADVLELLGDPAITDSMPAYRLGTVSDGRIDDLSASSMAAIGVGDLIGANGTEQFALLRFRGIEATDETLIRLGIGLHDIAFFPPIWDTTEDFEFEQQAIAVEAFGDPEFCESVNTDVSACLVATEVGTQPEVEP